MRKEYDFSSGKRGPVKEGSPNKVRITIRLDTQVVDWFKNQVHSGGNYQTLINSALSEYIESHSESDRESLEQLIRRVMREELKERDQIQPS